MLPPLRMRAHKTTVKMEYDDQYAPFFRRARLLGFVLQFKHKPSTLVHSALTALIDRWRPETHIFHLPCGEMTVTLEDWAMITALPLEGRPLTGRVERANWPERVVSLIGDCPAAKSNRTSGIPLSWLLEHRSKCPEDAEPRVVEQYARAYLWYILTEVVFPDCSGNSALWMYLDFLKDWDAGYSWGAAGLAYLYRSVSEYHFLSNIRRVLLYILTSYHLNMVCSLTTRPRERKSRPVCVDVYGASPFGCGSESRWAVRRSCARVHGRTMAKMTKMIGTRPSHTLGTWCLSTGRIEGLVQGLQQRA